MANPIKNSRFINKICEGCNKEFTINYRKKQQRFCSKSCAQHTPSVIEKMKASQLKTYMKNYGVEHPMKTDLVIKKFKKAMFNKYGVEYALQKKEFFNKLIKTKEKRYGNANYNNRDLCKKTCLEKYGVEFPSRNACVKNSSITTNRKKQFNNLIDLCKEKSIVPVFEYKDYTKRDFLKKYKFRCTICNKEFISTVYKTKYIFCDVCNLLDTDISKNELFDFISSITPPEIEIKRNDKTILYGKHLDIYIPFKKIAFELNELYWHSDFGNGIKRYYHFNKYKSCITHNVRLINIFENEWNYKKDIVKSVIKNILGLITNKIYARDCIIKEIENKEKEHFLNDNHLQGNDNSSIRYGLYNEDVLVAVMTFGKSRFDKNIQYEMYRFCNKINTHVIGGASKLFLHFIENYVPQTVVSYNDIRYFDGTLYQKLGFNFIKNTPPNYWYIGDDYKTLYNRIQFQKHKLPTLIDIFDINLTEWENMRNNGFDRIWDCGNGKWVFKNPKFTTA